MATRSSVAAKSANAAEVVWAISFFTTHLQTEESLPEHAEVQQKQAINKVSFGLLNRSVGNKFCKSAFVIPWHAARDPYEPYMGLIWVYRSHVESMWACWQGS